jgi:hypothetical protein
LNGVRCSFITIIFTAIGLSADCFAVALSLSISKRGAPFRQIIRFPFGFGLFQAAMLVIGWLPAQLRAVHLGLRPLAGFCPARVYRRADDLGGLSREGRKTER